MRYRIDMRGFPTLWLTQEQFDMLKDALAQHEKHGFRDGWCRVYANGLTVEITECGLTADREPRR